ncbi:MAG TPA: hypothetical protein VI670_04475 [Thermoanaerobaculia bacterium]|jgi:hypothetical protein
MNVLALAVLFAASLGRFGGWADSPQGYFMTKAERAEWSKLTTEADAAHFVEQFLAARGPAFAADVAAAARDADEHLTVAGRKGSTTLRGKIAIVLGRPSSVTIAPWSGGDKSATMATHLDTAHPQPVMNLPPSTERPSDLRRRYSIDYKLAYPKTTIVVSVDPITGDDRILSARMARDVDAMLEEAAKARRLTAFSGWAGSPQGYFMTKAERAEWSKLTTEADAAKFVETFLAKRGPAFAADVAAAANEADENLTVDGRKGSTTLRGKIVILLGRPSSVTIAPWSGDKSATMATHLSTGVPHPQPVVNLPPSTERTSDLRRRYSTDYKLAYPEQTIVVAVDPITGDDRILDARMAREVEAMLEAAKAKRVTR